jgi:hypothetical protein
MNTAITTFGASERHGAPPFVPTPHCLDLIVNQERHVMTASQECFVV